jgi:two-component system chemotaxis response regulator CheY
MVKSRYSKTVLIADDSASVREVIQTMLTEMEFFNIILAEDGYEALVSFKERPPDLVLLDMSMPKMDGLETIKIMLKMNPLTKIVLVTAFDKTERMVKDSIAEGAYDLLEKPITKEKLLRVVTRIEKEEGGAIDLVESAIKTIDELQASTTEEGEMAPENMLVFEFDTAGELNKFSLAVVKMKNVGIKNIQIRENNYVVTVSIRPKSVDRIL